MSVGTDERRMMGLRIGVVGAGKMGISHLSIINAHPAVELVGVCDTTNYLLDVLHKYSELPTFTDYAEMIRPDLLDAVIIATPTKSHAPMIEAALNAGVHVFCEKPLCLDPSDSRRFAAMADARGIVTQVGYHNRYVGAFAEVKRLLEAGAIGKVTHVLAEAYGPVVLAPKGRTWRSQSTEGGGCLSDYAAHPLDLLAWYLGEPYGVGGTTLQNPFSRETEDEVASTIYYPDGVNAQLSVSWSDDSQRKMTTKITLWGTEGRIYADRQEVQVYLRDTATPPEGYVTGWNTRYTTDLTDPVWFYLRGEEYSAQLADFVRRVQEHDLAGRNTFTSATTTDEVIRMMQIDAQKGPSTLLAATEAIEQPKPRPRRRWWMWRKRRVRPAQPTRELAPARV